MKVRFKRLLVAIALGLALAGNVWTATHNEPSQVAGSKATSTFGRESY
jgi:hypothetical protein